MIAQELSLEISQENISAATPMGATLLPGGVAFRVWAPRAEAVYVDGVFDGQPCNGQTPDRLLRKDGNGYWTGFQAGAREGDLYRFWVVGTGGSGYKRDPYARELATDADFPNCSCIVRSADAYPWHDAAFVTPDFSNMIVYQIHIGTYAIGIPGVASNFLDVIGKIPYLAALGINVLQPLPVDEVETDPSMGYNGADLFSPDFAYVETDAHALNNHLNTINGLLEAKGMQGMALEDISSGPAQLRALVDLCHVYGIAVAFDAVYNHAGGFTVNDKLDDSSLYYFDRVPDVGNNNDSLYFTDKGLAGGLSFALWNNDVRQFLLNNAAYWVNEFHVDGFRYDEISQLLNMNGDSGWSFCNDLTGTLRFIKPRILQNAEFWPSEDSCTRSSIVAPVSAGGAGFDAVQHDSLRSAIRNAVQAASAGRDAQVSMDAIAEALFPADCAHGWQAVTCVENHDLVKAGRDPRIAALADPSDHRSWYARSRSRLAAGLLLTAPGIPQLFMGQEFLEDKQWDVPPNSPNLIWWQGLENGTDPAMVNHLRFTQDLIRLRWNQPALRSDCVNPFHVHDENRVLAFHRWIQGEGQDVVVVCTFAEETWRDYAIGFPSIGQWREVFNSDCYDNPSSPDFNGNEGGIWAADAPLHGFPASASIAIPANGFVVFVRE